MCGDPVLPTKKQRPESWLAFVARIRKFRRLRTCWRMRFRDAYPCRGGVSGLLHANRIDRLCFAGGGRKSIPDERHCQSQKNGSRNEEGKNKKKKKKKKKKIDRASHL